MQILKMAPALPSPSQTLRGTDKGTALPTAIDGSHRRGCTAPRLAAFPATEHPKEGAHHNKVHHCFGETLAAGKGMGGF